jgi:4a-hydroxytetrahydrobiopterin dehydratase
MKKPDDRTVARVVLLNLLALPGLGSLRAGRWFEGVGQVALAMIGSATTLVWLYKELSQYYGLMFDEVKPHPVGWIGVVGGVLICVSLLWALVTSINYHRAHALQSPGPVENPVPGNLKATTPPVLVTTEASSDWRRNGEIISRTFQFKDFPAAMQFVNAVAQIAEQVQHHPDIDIRWNKVTLALTTHDAGGLTEKDFAMARQCDALALR